MEITQEESAFSNLAVWINHKEKRIGIVVQPSGEEDELVIDLSIDQARTITDSLARAIEELEGRKAVIL